MPRRSSYPSRKNWNPHRDPDSAVCASCGAEAGFQREESEFDGSQGGYWMHADDGTPCSECATRHGRYSLGSYHEGDLVMPSKEWEHRKGVSPEDDLYRYRGQY